MLALFTTYCSDDEMLFDEMGGTCGRYGGENSCIQVVGVWA